jgi:hypothetical protein
MEKNMKSLIIIEWIINSILCAFGLFWAFYGYLEFTGFGDGGTLPSHDFRTILVGFSLFILGILGLYNSKTKFKRIYTSRIYIGTTILLALSISITGYFTMLKYAQYLLSWIIIICISWFFPVISYILHRNKK